MVMCIIIVSFWPRRLLIFPRVLRRTPPSTFPISRPGSCVVGRIQGVRRLRELPQTLIDEITHFFVSYNDATGKTYTPSGAFGPRKARAMIEAGITRRQSAISRTKKRKRRGTAR